MRLPRPGPNPVWDGGASDPGSDGEAVASHVRAGYERAVVTPWLSGVAQGWPELREAVMDVVESSGWLELKAPT